MVWHRYDMVRTESLDSLITQCVKCLRRSNLVAVKTINIQLSWAILHILHNMRIPNLVK